jgi:hypothetical protein
MPAIPKSLSKQVYEYVSTAYDVGKLTYRLLRLTNQLEFSLAKKNPYSGELESHITHTVDLTADERAHLDDGGRLVLIHACGWQAHIKI